MWPTISEEAYDRFEEQGDLEAEREMHRKNREFYEANKDTITYSDGTVEIIELGIIQGNISEENI